MTGTALVAVGPDDWGTWLEIRLRALVDAPSAFGSTYAETSRMTEEQVRTRLDHQGTGEAEPLRPGRPETVERMVLGPAAAAVPQAGSADMSGH